MRIIEYKHSIQSIIFDVSLPDRADVEVFSESVRAMDIQAVFERIFKQYDTISKRILIENLTLDLGNVSYDDLEEKLKEALAEKLHQVIDSHAQLFSFTALLNEDESALEALMEFLKFGSLNWTYKNIQDFDIEVIIKKIIHSKSTVIKQKLSEIITYRVVQERLIRYISDDSFRAIYLLFINETELSFIMELIAFFKQNFINNAMNKNSFIHEILLQNIALTHFRSNRIEVLTQQLIQKIDIRINNDIEQQKAIIQNLKKIQEKHQNQVIFLKSLVFFQTKLEEKTGWFFDKKNKSETDEKSIQKNEEKKFIKDDELINEAIELDEEDKPESYFIENAGLVIVWYHFPQLLKHLGLVQNRQFVDTKAQMKALTVLDFIVFGNRKIKEHGLTLNKLLVGLEPEDTIEISLPLSDNEIVIINDFLEEAIIKQWAILKNTSIEGLREAFLKRSGKLTRTANGWFLQVESKGGIDILLDSLPWGLSFVKLNWMPKPLIIEWKRK